MSKVIWKFPIKSSNEAIEMPIGAQILSAQLQGGVPTLWAICTSEAADAARLEHKVAYRHFRVVGTGHEIPDHEADRMKFIATTQDSPFVWHIFEDIQ